MNDFDSQVASKRRYLIQFALKHWGLSYEDAEDAAQSTILKALVKRSYDPKYGSIGTWLCTVMRNEQINEYRKRDKAKKHYDFYVVDQNGKEKNRLTWDKKYSLKQKVKRVMGRLSSLSDCCRDITYMRLIAEKSYLELADCFEVPIGTVKSRIYRGIVELRKVV